MKFKNPLQTSKEEHYWGGKSSNFHDSTTFPEPSKEEMLSNCCKTPLKTFNSADYDNEETSNGSTCYFICSKCQKPCDVYVEPSKEEKDKFNKKIIDAYEGFIPKVYEACRFIQMGAGKKYAGNIDILVQIINQHEKEMWSDIEKAMIEPIKEEPDSK